MPKNKKAQDALLRILREHGGLLHLVAVEYELYGCHVLNADERRYPEAIIGEAQRDGKVLYDPKTGCLSLVEVAQE